MINIRYITSPYQCLYWTTFRCNSKCEYCNIWKNPLIKEIPDAKISDVKINLQDLKRIGIRKIDFTGGEPLLNKDIISFLKYAKKLKFFIKLSTNGLLYADYAYDLKDLTNIIYFSLDGLSESEYYKTRGVNGFKTVMNSINIAKELDQNFSIIYTVTNKNIKNIKKMTEFCIKNKIQLFINPCFSYFKNPELSRKNINLIKNYFFKPYIKMNLPHINFQYKGGNRTTYPSCRAGLSAIDISPDNFLFIPCFHKFIKKIRINGNLYSLYQSKEWKKLYEKVGHYTFCENCSIECYFGKSIYDIFSFNFFRYFLIFSKYFIENFRS